jgi:polyhydroxyalkanoate synthase subunit PhaC
MDETSSAGNDPSVHLKYLMQVGQQSAQQFDDALALAMGVAGGGGGMPDASASPWTIIAQMQLEFVSRLFRFWAENLIQMMTLGAHSSFESASVDKRFRDTAWQETPYYDLLKQSYLLGSKLRFYARQFIDAMSPSNFPATNPDVIRAAIQTRSASLVAGMQNFIEDVQKGRITRVDEAAFEVGGNLAVTPGSVVFENELIQIIQYAPAPQR